jgi:CubicO group peptidase (beta-lactamase class C family)
VIERFDADGKPVIRPARGPITLRQLLTHTAGFSGAYWNPTMKRYMEENQIAGADLAVLGTPLVADPGTIWEYGISTDWVGQIVERISGLRLDAYFDQHIFGPLGMADSGFLLPDDQRSRLASLHQRQADGSLQVIPHTMRPNPAFLRGAGGLHSTARDYLRFLRALLHGGTLDGAQILRPETVVQMGQNQIGDIDVPVMRTASPMHSYDAEFYPGMRKKWGLAYFITTEDAPTGRSAGSLAWAGLFNTYYWLDPVKNVTGLMLTQVLPFADPIVLDIFGDFERAVYGL